MIVKGIMIEQTDQVITLAGPAGPGDVVVYKAGEETRELRPAENIPVYHKMACAKIGEGQVVRKYGQPIGTALKDINIGEWVHTHNLRSTCLVS